MTFEARIPADFPIVGDWPFWLFLFVVAIAMSGIWVLNNFYFAWLHRKFPGLLRSRALLAILALGIGVIVAGMIINPPAQIQKSMNWSQPN